MRIFCESKCTSSAYLHVPEPAPKNRENPLLRKEMWRERVRIELTGDTPCRPVGFEDHEGHQYPIRPHVDGAPGDSRVA